MAKTVAIYEDTPNGRFRLGVFTPRNVDQAPPAD